MRARDYTDQSTIAGHPLAPQFWSAPLRPMSYHSSASAASFAWSPSASAPTSCGDARSATWPRSLARRTRSSATAYATDLGERALSLVSGIQHTKESV